MRHMRLHKMQTRLRAWAAVWPTPSQEMEEIWIDRYMGDGMAGVQANALPCGYIFSCIGFDVIFIGCDVAANRTVQSCTGRRLLEN